MYFISSYQSSPTSTSTKTSHKVPTDHPKTAAAPARCVQPFSRSISSVTQPLTEPMRNNDFNDVNEGALTVSSKLSLVVSSLSYTSDADAAKLEATGAHSMLTLNFNLKTIGIYLELVMPCPPAINETPFDNPLW